MKYTGIPAGLFALMIQILVLCFACYGMETGAENGEEDSVECYHISHVQGEIDWDMRYRDWIWMTSYGCRTRCTGSRALGSFAMKGYVVCPSQATSSRTSGQNTLSRFLPVCQDSCLEFFLCRKGKTVISNYEISTQMAALLYRIRTRKKRQHGALP